MNLLNFQKQVVKKKKKQNLPDGELMIHGSRASQTKCLDLDIDVILRVDENLFDEFANNRINSIYPGSLTQKTVIKAANKGELSKFDISKTFNKDFHSILKINSPIEDIDFSITKRDTPFDSGKIEDIKKE